MISPDSLRSVQPTYLDNHVPANMCYSKKWTNLIISDLKVCRTFVSESGDIEMSNIIFSLLIICSSLGVSDAAQTRLRLALKSCDFVDLSVAGMICGGGKKIKYLKVVAGAVRNDLLQLSHFLSGEDSAPPEAHDILGRHHGPHHPRRPLRETVVLLPLGSEVGQVGRVASYLSLQSHFQNEQN